MELMWCSSTILGAAFVPALVTPEKPALRLLMLELSSTRHAVRDSYGRDK